MSKDEKQFVQALLTENAELHESYSSAIGKTTLEEGQG